MLQSLLKGRIFIFLCPKHKGGLFLSPFFPEETTTKLPIKLLESENLLNYTISHILESGKIELLLGVLGFSIFGLAWVSLFSYTPNFIILVLRLELTHLGLSLILFSHLITYGAFAELAYLFCLFGLIAAETTLGLSLFLYYYLTKKDVNINLLEKIEIFH